MTNGIFNQIPLWKDDGECFAVQPDRERIPATRLESWNGIHQMMESKFINTPNRQYIFRGQRRSDWGLMPTLGRITNNGVITEEMAKSQLQRFKLAIRGRIKDISIINDDDELWAIGQHHGLKTPLLDWTYSPFVALFFAFSEEDKKNGEHENPYRAVYAIDQNFIKNHQSESGIRLLEPKIDIYGRLVNQAGLFTFSPFGETIENKLANILMDEEGVEDEELKTSSESEEPNRLARYIFKIYIKNDGRESCLRQLRRMNIHHSNLFPDMIGAAEYCNINAEEDSRELSNNHYDKKPKESTNTHKTLSLESNNPKEQSTQPLPAKAEQINEPLLMEEVKNAIIDAVNEMRLGHAIPNEILGKIQMDIVNIVIQNAVIDWKERESVLAAIRTGVSRSFRSSKLNSDTAHTLASVIVSSLISNHPYEAE
jgi:FRG domain protein